MMDDAQLADIVDRATATRADVVELVRSVARLRRIVAAVEALPEKIRKLPDGKSVQFHIATLIEEAIDAEVQNGFTREAREAVHGNIP